MENRQLCEKIGIMGGTFNPIHNGHLALARHAKEQLQLSKVLFIPTGKSYMKKSLPVLPGEVRLQMTSLAICDDDGFEASDMEILRSGNTYTYETVEELKKESPWAVFYYLVGADTLLSMEKWLYPERIFANCVVVAVARDGQGQAALEEKACFLQENFGAQIKILSFEEVNISSSDIRIRRTKNESISDMVPRNVAEYIYENGLYENESYPMPYSEEFAEFIKAELSGVLSAHRYEHVLAVADVAKMLASKYGYPVEKAYITGLLHDCAKHLPDEELLHICAKENIPVSETEKANAQLLHAKVGAYIAKNHYQMYNQELLDAITYHTTGRPGMSVLEKIIFVADFIEPGRKGLPLLEEKRQMAQEDLNQAFFMILEGQLSYLNSSNQVVDPMTQKTYDYYAMGGK